MKMTDDEQLEIKILTYHNNFLLQTIFEDYAVRMAKLDGINAAQTMEKLNRITHEKMDEDSKKRSARKLPTKVKKTSEIKTIYTIAACSKLHIPYEITNFDSKKLLVEIDSKDSGIGKALHDFFKKYASYRFFYKSLKNDGKGSFSYYQSLEAEMNVQQRALDKLLQQKSGHTKS